jgi:hypothetical protein
MRIKKVARILAHVEGENICFTCEKQSGEKEKKADLQYVPGGDNTKENHVRCKMVCCLRMSFFGGLVCVDGQYL